MGKRKRNRTRDRRRSGALSRRPQVPTGLQLLEYEVTEEPMDDAAHRLPAEVESQYEDLYESLHRTPARAVGRLEALIEKHPEVAQLYNLLAGAYSRSGQHEKAEDIIERNYRQNPDYLFARLNYAELCLSRGEMEKVREVLDNKFDLKLLYPHRRRFHITEFVNFMYVVGSYHWKTGDQEMARASLRTMRQVAPKHEATEHLARLLDGAALRKALAKAMESLLRRGRSGGEAAS